MGRSERLIKLGNSWFSPKDIYVSRHVALPGFGIITNWWAVFDFVKVVVPVGIVIFGVLSILAGISSVKKSK